MVAITTDNAENIKKAIKKLGKFPWFGCFGHTLNLVVKRALKKSTVPMTDIPLDLTQSQATDSDEEERDNGSDSNEDEQVENQPRRGSAKADKSAFSILHKKFKDLARFVHKSSNAKVEFKACQEKANATLPEDQRCTTNLKQDIATRWNREAIQCI